MVEKLTDSDHELWMANWQPGPAGPVPVISSKLPVGFARPASDAKVTKAYVPPSARGRPASASIKGRISFLVLIDYFRFYLVF